MFPTGLFLAQLAHKTRNPIDLAGADFDGHCIGLLL